MNPHQQIENFEYDYIIDGIFIGTNQCCQPHFDERLKRAGIKADVSLEEERLDAPFGVETYVWIPVKDHAPPTLDQLEFGVTVLEKLVQLNKKVYVHCQKGHGRAPTLVAAYLVKKGRSVEEAIEFIKSKRPTIHIENDQKAMLVRYAKR